MAVPVPAALPGTVAGVQFALALKSKFVSGLVTVGLADQVASCAQAGTVKKSPASRAAAAKPKRISNFATPHPQQCRTLRRRPGPFKYRSPGCFLAEMLPQRQSTNP